ncbi:hypothetical protein PWY87_03615 [Kribbella solani]|nr:hypothetical protein [Kribbella solani]MDX2968346.1 hypothetical protein [Kribbella solani]MDX3000747.1 hypothetical protein [Kribbella solani]
MRQTEFIDPATPAVEYEPPELYEVGDVIQLTNGSTSNDTADRKAYYY